MNRTNVLSLREMFNNLRKYSQKENRFWMGRYYEKIYGYIRALYHCSVIDDITYNKILDIANCLSSEGNYKSLRKAI